jgi:hypothetical protein
MDVVLSQALLLCGVLVPLGLLIFVTSIPQRAFLPNSGACDPDGNFSPDRTFYMDSSFSIPFELKGKVFSEWSRDSFFQITLDFGHLPFSTVKVIDIMWDVLVGRGGQLCLGFLVYKNFTKALVRIMERATVTYDMFWSINIEPTSVQSIYRMSRDVLKTASIRFRSAIILMACSSACLIAFPNVVGAMSGYSTNIAAFAPDHNNALIPFTNFVPIVYVINHGSRLNLGDRYLVSGNWKSGDSAARRYDSCQGLDSDYCPYCKMYLIVTFIIAHTKPQVCSDTSISLLDVNAFSLDTVHNVSSMCNLSSGMVKLEPSTLNISAFYIPDGDFAYSIGTDESGRYRDPTRAVFSWNNATFSRDYIIKYGSFMPELPTTYKRGFSFLALWSFMLVSAGWAIVIYALWLDAYPHNRLDRRSASKRVTGSYKVALDLIKAINQNFGEDVTGELTDLALRKRIWHDIDGGHCHTRHCFAKAKRNNAVPRDTTISIDLENHLADGRSTGGFVLALVLRRRHHSADLTST